MFIGCRKTVLGDLTDRCLPILSLSLSRFSVEINLPIFHAYVRMENVSRRRRREAKKRGVRKSVSVGVCSNALATRSRLSKRTESHSREHLWSLPASLLFFFTLLRLPLSLFLAYDPGGPRFCYLPVLLLTAHRPIVGDPRAALKGLAQFSTRDSTRLDGPGRFQVGEVKITTRHQRRSIVIRRRM